MKVKSGFWFHGNTKMGGIKYPNLKLFKYGFIINEGGTKVIDFNTSGAWVRIAFYFNTFGHFYFNIGLMKYRPYLLFKIGRLQNKIWQGQ